MNERAVKHFALGQGQHAYQRSAVVQLCTMLLLCGSLAAAAAETLGWDSLSAEQQYTLARLRPRWHSLNAAARHDLVRRADIWRATHAAPSADAPKPAKRRRPLGKNWRSPASEERMKFAERHRRHASTDADTTSAADPPIVPPRADSDTDVNDQSPPPKPDLETIGRITEHADGSRAYREMFPAEAGDDLGTAEAAEAARARDK